MLGVVFAQHLHTGKDAVALVFAQCGQHHLRIGGQLQVDIFAGVVGEGVAPYFGKMVLQHGDVGAGLDAVVAAQEAHLVAGKADAIVLGHHVERGVGVAPQAVAFQVADEEVGAVMVGTDFAVSVQVDVLIARKTAAPVVEHHGEFAVAEHADFRHVGDAVIVAGVALGLHFAVLVALVLRHFQVDIGLHLRFLLQQGFHRLHNWLLHKVLLQAASCGRRSRFVAAAAGQVVGKRSQYHTLVVGIVGADGYAVFFVVAFVESELVVHIQIPEIAYVLVYGAVVDRNGHQRAVGRQDDAVGRGVLELEVWDTEGVILIVLRVVQLVVGGLRNAPRHTRIGDVELRIANECPLGADGEAVGLVHQRVLVGGQEDERHKVLKQRAVPRCNALVALVLHQRLVEAEPMLVGGVALGDGEERR